MRLPARGVRLPLLLSALGVGGLFGSWACFPPIPLVRAPVAQPAERVSTAPTTRPSAALTPVPNATPTPRDVAPYAARVYTYTTTGGDAPATLRITIATVVANGAVTYSSLVTPADLPRPATEATPTPSSFIGQATQTLGIYWILPGDSPVTKAIDTYPSESVETPVYTGPARKVEFNGATYWFVDGVIVKAVIGPAVTELSSLEG